MAPPMTATLSGGNNAAASGSANRSASVIAAPRLLSRRSSTKEGNRPSGLILRRSSAKGKAKEDEGAQSAVSGMDGWRSPVLEGENPEV